MGSESMAALPPAARAPIAAAAASVVVLWASSFVAVQLALEDLAPGPLALARYAVASLVFLALLPVRRCALPPPGDLLRMAAAGGTGIALYNFALNSGQRTVGAGVASLLINTVPIWTTVLSVLLLKERIRPLAWAGGLVSLSGVTLIALERGGSSGLQSGALMILAAALAQALFFVIQKPLLSRYHPIDLTAYAIWFGSIFLLPFGGGLFDSLRASSNSTLLAVLFLGVGPAALAYLAWSYVLSKVPAGRASNLLFLVPVATITLGWIVLSELPSRTAFGGGALALFGVLLTRRASQ